MIRLIRFLITGDWHLHKWEEVRRGGITGKNGKVSGYFYDCKCEICGNHKVFNLR